VATSLAAVPGHVACRTGYALECGWTQPVREWLEGLLTLRGPLPYVLVGLLVFAEDAVFIGFIVPGETAAILGGVAASLGQVSPIGIAIVVIAAAILGDTVAYGIGRWLGPRLLDSRFLRNRRDLLRLAEEHLARHGGAAVFFGRFVTFLHAVMPTLAGAARMPYSRFLAYNGAGAVVWGAGTVLLGYLAGTSYEAIAKAAGRGTALVVAMIAIAALIVWRIRRARHRAHEAATAPDDGAGG
jgi:membrane protein DedA with SNARE-associated domain